MSSETLAVMRTTVDLTPAPGYLRADFLRDLGHDGLMRLLVVLTNTRDRDRADDETLDRIALELARRQSPLCNVCAIGATGACDERCDRIAGA